MLLQILIFLEDIVNAVYSEKLVSNLTLLYIFANMAVKHYLPEEEKFTRP